MRDSSSTTAHGSEYLYSALVDAGIELLVGLPGTQTLPLDRTVAERSDMRYVMARHETAIPHIAWGYFEARGGVAATLTVPGPGDTNAMHGLKNALDDGVPIIHISADVNPEERGMRPIHEIDPDTYDNVVKENINIESSIDLLEGVQRGITSALTPPQGPVRLGIPNNVLNETHDLPHADVSPERLTFDTRDSVADAVELLTNASRPVVYVGCGGRTEGAPPAVEELVAKLEAPVVSSYKGKGVYPEDEPNFVGVTGSHLSESAREVLRASDTVLALGTAFDGVTTGHWELPMGDRLIHVSHSSEPINRAYDADVVIRDDVSSAARSLVSGLDGRTKRTQSWSGREIGRAVNEEYETMLRERGLLSNTSPALTPAVLRAVREAIPRDGIVTTDTGGFRLWAMQVFEAYSPESYITAGSWAGMGVGLPAAIGAQVAHPDRPVVALTGDGGLMMCIHELHTAVELSLDITTVVFNNSDYGIISKSPEIKQYTKGHRFDWNSPDFTQIAEGFGCRATKVDSPTAVQEAVKVAVDKEGPDLVEVGIDTDESPVTEVNDYESTLELAED